MGQTPSRSSSACGEVSFKTLQQLRNLWAKQQLHPQRVAGAGASGVAGARLRLHENRCRCKSTKHREREGEREGQQQGRRLYLRQHSYQMKKQRRESEL